MRHAPSREYLEEISTSPLVSHPLLGAACTVLPTMSIRNILIGIELGEPSSFRFLRTGSNHVTSRQTNGQWAPGQSGNPGGRPGGVAEVRELARRHTAEAIERLVKEMSEGDTSRARIAGRMHCSIADGESQRSRLPATPMSRRLRSRTRSDESRRERWPRRHLHRLPKIIPS